MTPRDVTARPCARGGAGTPATGPVRHQLLTCVTYGAHESAGVPCEKGNEKGGMQPPTLMFCLAGADTEKLRLSIANHTRTYL
ncbi:MAG: hypothetical protein ACREF9_11360, partial [Opitutaceae bacterium]